MKAQAKNAENSVPTYILTCEKSDFPVYGIAALMGGRTVDVIADYDTDKTFVSALVLRLNNGGARLCHFKEILEDELAAARPQA